MRYFNQKLKVSLLIRWMWFRLLIALSILRKRIMFRLSLIEWMIVMKWNSNKFKIIAWYNNTPNNTIRMQLEGFKITEGRGVMGRTITHRFSRCKQGYLWIWTMDMELMDLIRTNSCRRVVEEASISKLENK